MTFHNFTLENSKLANQTYVVGGYLRDSALGIPSNDIDYVITCNEDTFKLHFPYSKTVGNSFPVYLIEGEEVALSRTEESVGHGYGNFNLTGVGVSIEEDLSRRDFTICAIAQNIVTGEIVDPFDGFIDLKNEIIRTTYKNSFKDDPVRILRGIRFASRFNFELAPETINQIEKFKNELKYITKERIVLELQKTWKQVDVPSKYFQKLSQYNILSKIFPGITELDVCTLNQIDKAKSINAEFHIFMSLVMKDIFNVHEFLVNHKFTKCVNSFVPKMQEIKLNQILGLNCTELAKLTLKIGKRDFDDVYTVASLHKLSEKEKIIFETMRELLFFTDFSWLEDIEPKLRSIEALKFRKNLYARINK